MRKNLFLRKFLRYSISSKISEKICQFFENTRSGTAVKTAFNEFIGTIWQWIGEKLFTSFSDFWMSGFRKFLGKFPAVLSTLLSACPWVGTIERASFSCEKVFFVFAWASDFEHKNFSFPDEKFLILNISFAYYVSGRIFRGKGILFFNIFGISVFRSLVRKGGLVWTEFYIAKCTFRRGFSSCELFLFFPHFGQMNQKVGFWGGELSAVKSKFKKPVHSNVFEKKSVFWKNIFHFFLILTLKSAGFPWKHSTGLYNLISLSPEKHFEERFPENVNMFH